MSELVVSVTKEKNGDFQHTKSLDFSCFLATLSLSHTHKHTHTHTHTHTRTHTQTEE